MYFCRTGRRRSSKSLSLVLGQSAALRQPKPQLVVSQKTGTDDQQGPQAPDYGAMSETPAVFRKNRATVEAMQQSGVDKYDIPAFLRKQAD